MSQAVDDKDRYRPVVQHDIKVGDIVLLKETHTKPNNYPMGLIKELEVNSNGEVTDAVVLKGKTRELVKRHISTLIPFLASDLPTSNVSNNPDDVPDNVPVSGRVQRQAAVTSEQRTRQILNCE